jgi:hypothetical protein
MKISVCPQKVLKNRTGVIFIIRAIQHYFPYSAPPFKDLLPFFVCPKLIRDLTWYNREVQEQLDRYEKTSIIPGTW